MDVNTKWPKVLLCYDFANGITDEEKEIIFYVESKLFTIGITTLLEPGTLVSYIAPKTNLEELKFDFPHTPKEILIDEDLAHLNV